MTNEELLKTLNKDIQKIESKLQHRKTCNVKNGIITSLLKLGIALDYAHPFILAGIAIAYLHYRTPPFDRGQIIEYENVEETKTSTGYERKLSSFDVSYSEESFKHSTAWEINEMGFYERTITSYKVSFKKYASPEELLGMTKEEVESLLEIANIDVIQKKELEEEDLKYNQDIFILVESYQDQNSFMMRPETNQEYFLRVIIYLFMTMIDGLFITEAERRNFALKYYPKDFFRKLTSQFRIITKEEQIILEKELKIKKQNLEMLSEDARTYCQSEAKVLKKGANFYAK